MLKSLLVQTIYHNYSLYSSKICLHEKKKTLQKQAYSNVLKLLPPKNENFQIKIWIFFIFLLKNIDCGYSVRHSNKYPQSMFLSKNKKNNVYRTYKQIAHWVIQYAPEFWSQIGRKNSYLNAKYAHVFPPNQYRMLSFGNQRQIGFASLE